MPATACGRLRHAARSGEIGRRWSGASAQLRWGGRGTGAQIRSGGQRLRLLVVNDCQKTIGGRTGARRKGERATEPVLVWLFLLISAAPIRRVARSRKAERVRVQAAQRISSRCSAGE